MPKPVAGLLGSEVMQAVTQGYFLKVFYAVRWKFNFPKIIMVQKETGLRLKGEECETDLGSRCLASPTHRHLGSPGWMVQLHDITQGWLRV